MSIHINLINAHHKSILAWSIRVMYTWHHIYKRAAVQNHVIIRQKVPDATSLEITEWFWSRINLGYQNLNKLKIYIPENTTYLAYTG